MTIACKNLICNMFRKVVFDPLTETEARKWKDGISRARNPLLRDASDSICAHTSFGWSRKSDNEKKLHFQDETAERQHVPRGYMLAPGAAGWSLGGWTQTSVCWGAKRPRPLSPGFQLVMGCLAGVWDLVGKRSCIINSTMSLGQI